MLISGIYLWWPAKRARRKQAFSLKSSGSFKRLNYDLHSVLGFYGLGILLAITLTGMWWSFDWYKHAVYGILGEKFQKPIPVLLMNPEDSRADSKKLDTVFTASLLQYPSAKAAHIENGKNYGEAARIRLEYPLGLYKKRNEIFYNPKSGAILETRLWNDYTDGEIYKHANYEIHTGRGFGLLGKIIAFFASLFAASLPVSGFYIWYGRTYKQSKKKPMVKRENNVSAVFKQVELVK